MVLIVVGAFKPAGVGLFAINSRNLQARAAAIVAEFCGAEKSRLLIRHDQNKVLW
jgi:hypothetical protein